MTGTLFDIAEDIRTLVEAIAYTENDDDCKALAEDFLAKREGDLDSKIDAYCTVIRERLALMKSRKEESTRLRELADTDEATAKRMKDTLKHVMENILERPRIETKIFKLNVQNSGGVRALELRDGLDLSKAPEMYVVMTPTVDTEALRVDLEAREKEIADIAQFLVPEGEKGYEESRKAYNDAVIAIDTKYKEALEMGSLRPRGRHVVIR